MLAVAGLAEFELGAAAGHFDALVDEELDAIDEAEFAGLSVDDGQHDDAEADLELGVLVEVVEDDLGLFAALELEDDAHAVAVALVADIADAVDILFVDEGTRGLDEARLVDLVAKAYLIGAAGEDFARTLGDELPFERCGELENALAASSRDAARSAAAEPVVLLSP